MMQTLAMAFLAATAIGGIAWVFIYPLLSGERKTEQRVASVARSEPLQRTGNERNSPGARRGQIENTLKEIDDRAKKAKKISIRQRLDYAGLELSAKKFYVVSAIAGGMVFLLVLMMSGNFIAALAFGFAGGFGLPRWVLRFLKKRREKKFLEALPDAVDVIVRGVKSGLPLFDSIKVVASDSPDPLRGEFQGIVETQAIGMPLAEACTRLYDRMPLPEANFFGIVISIQQKSGGNLSEALGNLSRVLRDRKKMRAKIQAMSMEAKASAGIIAALPPSVMFLVYLTSPKYIELLWTTSGGRVMLAGCAVWMTMGCLVMRKMINFDI
jgi:tight adherence protein B